jgi:hypothetical protein
MDLTSYAGSDSRRPAHSPCREARSLPSLAGQDLDCRVESHSSAGARPRSQSYLFIGQWPGLPLSDAGVRLRWSTIRSDLGIQGLWTYDLRRTMSCYMSNELNYDDHTVRAILNHYDRTALGRYSFKSFDSLTVPLQQYADWLWTLKGTPCYAPDPLRSSSTQVHARLSAAPVRLALDDQAERMLGPVPSPVLPVSPVAATMRD